MNENSICIYRVESLPELKQEIVVFREATNDLLQCVDTHIKQQMDSFRQAEQILLKRMQDAQNDLVSAEYELRTKRERKVPRELSDGRVVYVTPDCSAEERKVEVARRRYDECKRKYDRCKKIIVNCDVKIGGFNYSQGRKMRHLIGEHTQKTVHCLTELTNYAYDYLGISTRENAELNPLQQIKMPQNNNNNNNSTPPSMQQIFYDKNGNPIAGKRVYVTDNRVFGFRTEGYTDENGLIVIPGCNHLPNGSSIYLDGEKIYDGYVSGNMEYNKYGDRKILHNFQSGSNYDRERIYSEHLNDYINQEHRIIQETNATGDWRREEVFTRNNTGTLHTHSVNAVQDYREGRSNDGWVKHKTTETDN